MFTSVSVESSKGLRRASTPSLPSLESCYHACYHYDACSVYRAQNEISPSCSAQFTNPGCSAQIARSSHIYSKKILIFVEPASQPLCLPSSLVVRARSSDYRTIFTTPPGTLVTVGGRRGGGRERLMRRGRPAKLPGAADSQSIVLLLLLPLLSLSPPLCAGVQLRSLKLSDF